MPVSASPASCRRPASSAGVSVAPPSSANAREASTMTRTRLTSAVARGQVAAGRGARPDGVGVQLDDQRVGLHRERDPALGAGLEERAPWRPTTPMRIARSVSRRVMPSSSIVIEPWPMPAMAQTSSRPVAA